MHPIKTIAIFVIGTSLALGAVVGLAPASTPRPHPAASAVTTTPPQDLSALPVTAAPRR